MFKKVSAVYPAQPMQLLVWFSGGEVRQYDVAPLMEKWEPFKALRDPALFRCVHVDVGGYGISWNDDIDLSGNELWENGVPAAPAQKEEEALAAGIAAVRRQAKATQKQLEDATGIKQPVIARMESGAASPRLDTVLKVLAPLGKTLKIADL